MAPHKAFDPIEYLNKAPHFKIYHPFIKAMGTDPALVLSNLINKYCMFRNTDKLVDGHWFFRPNRMQCIDTGLTEYRLINAKKDLQKRGLLQCRMMGQPPKEFFLLNLRNMGQLIRQYDTDLGRTTDTDSGHIQVLEQTIKNKQCCSVKTKQASADESAELYFANGQKAQILKAWNNLPGANSHTKLTTKILERASALVTELMTGTFTTRRKLNPDFINRHKIPWQRLRQKKMKYSAEQIVQTIQKYDLMWSADRWPADKKVLPKSLDTFLLNHMKGTSFFFMVYYNDDILRTNSTKDNTLRSPYYPLFEWLANGHDTADIINQGLDRSERWVKANYDLNDKRVQYHFRGRNQQGPPLHRFFETYSKFLLGCNYRKDWLRQNPEAIFYSWGELFKDYIDTWGNKGLHPTPQRRQVINRTKQAEASSVARRRRRA